MNYDRKPIILNDHTIMVLQIFTRTSKLDDLWMHDIDAYIKAGYEQFDESAKQLIDQLEEHWCIAFIEALSKRCMQIIKDGDIEDNMCNANLAILDEKYKDRHANRAGMLLSKLSEISNALEKTDGHKTRFGSTMTIRIAKESSAGEDKFTQKEIMDMLHNRTAEIQNGASCHLICRKIDGKVMAQIEKFI